MSLIEGAIETDPYDPINREDYSRSNLKTMAPFDLDVEESV